MATVVTWAPPSGRRLDRRCIECRSMWILGLQQRPPCESTKTFASLDPDCDQNSGECPYQ